MQTTLDHNLFLALHFDGGPLADRLMLLCSSVWLWLPLYAGLLWAVRRREGWRNLLLFIGLALLSVVLTDLVAGMFKHAGLLKNALPESLTPRLRPMYTPELEGLVHVPKYGGLYGTVSAHAATTCSIAVLAATTLRRPAVTAGLAVWVAAVCYSRIYLAYHFPLDIAWGLLLGLLLGGSGAWAYRRLRHPFVGVPKRN